MRRLLSACFLLFLGLPWAGPGLLYAQQVPQKTQQFYDSLRHKAGRHYITRHMYRLMVRSQSHAHPPAPQSAPYDSAMEGRIVRDITTTGLPALGSSLREPDRLLHPSWWQRIGNALYFPSREAAIRENLLFSSGKPLRLARLEDNERLLRDLPYVRDARMRLFPVGKDSVDVDVVVQDQLTTGGYGTLGSRISRGGLLTDNFLGLGHQLRAGLSIDRRSEQKLGGEVRYGVRNIAATFADGAAYYVQEGLARRMGLGVSKEFVSPVDRLAWGASTGYVRELEARDVRDSLYRYARLDHDAFLATAWVLDDRGDCRRRLTLGGRYQGQRVLDRPAAVDADTLYELHSRYRVLATLSLNRLMFRKEQLLYAFGRTEDVPLGHNLSVTAGYEFGEFGGRPYMGLSLVRAGYAPILGYLYGQVEIGGYREQGRWVQKQLHVAAEYFTPHLGAGKAGVLRCFLRTDLRLGGERLGGEALRLGSRQGFGGFLLPELWGNKRWTVSQQTVLYSNLMLYGFRIHPFSRFDLGWLAPPEKALLATPMFSSWTLGVQLKNDMLVFDALQLAVGFRPRVPGDVSNFRLEATFFRTLRARRVEGYKPAVLGFE